jgi:hypothetical protein
MTYRTLNWAKVAEHLGVRRCRGIDPRFGGYCGRDHVRGEWADGMIHWGERRLTRLGLRRFLWIVAATPYGQHVPWARRYLTATTVERMAREMHVDLGEFLAAPDKAYVKANLVREPASPLRDEAMEWAGLVRPHMTQRLLGQEIRFQIDHARRVPKDRAQSIKRVRALREAHPEMFASYQVQETVGSRRWTWLAENE